MRLGEADEGIAARMAVRDATLVYELQIPLARNGPNEHGIGVAPGQAVSVEIETPEYQGPMAGPRPRGGPIGVSVGVGRGGVHGGYPMATDPRVLMKPLDVKTSVQLASGPPQ